MAGLAAAIYFAFGCIGPEDNPTTVHDLRVLGVSLEPPELMAQSCAAMQVLRTGEIPPDALALLAPLAAPVTLTAHIADPKGEGRDIEWELFACARQGDRTCDNADERVRIAAGRARPGDLVVPGLRLGACPAGQPPPSNQSPCRIDVIQPLGQITPLLLKVFEHDQFKGLGGLRMPIVLSVKAGEEQIYAQKLMVFSCRFFPDMKPNVTPVLPNLLLDGEPIGEGATVQGSGPFRLSVPDVSSLEEPYVVPSFELKPVHLVEAWKIAWFTDFGRIAPGETGGVDLGGQESRHRVEWTPGRDSAERDVTLWAVVRDGRGGQSWLVRRLKWKP